MTGEKRYLEDDFSDDPVSLYRSPDGTAVLLPRSARRLDEDQTLTLRELQSLGSQIAILEQQSHEVAREARDAGISWSLIGWALGLTGEAARLRYSD